MTVVVSIVDVRSGRVVVRIWRVQYGARYLIGLQLRIGEIVNHRCHIDEVGIASCGCVLTMNGVRSRRRHRR